jgi:hypothetical protein
MARRTGKGKKPRKSSCAHETEGRPLAKVGFEHQGHCTSKSARKIARGGRATAKLAASNGALPVA